MRPISSSIKYAALSLAMVCLSVLSSCGARGNTGASDSAAAQTEAAKADTLNLLFAGDAMQHGPQLKAALRAGGGKDYNYDDCFTLIAPEVKAADYAVVNLEVPLGGGPEYRGYPCFSAPDSYAIALREAGFDMMLTANNHCMDSGAKAAKRTCSALDQLKLDHIGTYADSTESARRIPFIKNIKGVKVGFLNYTYGTNGIPVTGGVDVALIDRDRIAREMKKTRAAGAELLVVTLHWGVEYNQIENETQRELAQFIADNGADLIIGAHPHVVQPMKVVHNARENKDVLIVYSLGNFLSNMDDTNCRGGALVRTRLVRGQDGKMRFDHADYDTFFTAKPEGSNKNYRVVPAWMPELIPAGQKATYKRFEQSAQKIFDENNVNVSRRHK